MSRSNRSSSSHHSSISRASFTSNPNFIPSKIVRSPAPSPRKRWLVNTTMRRDVHPMAINPALEYQTRLIKQELIQSLSLNATSKKAWVTNPDAHTIRLKHRKTIAPPPEADDKTQQKFIALLQERHLHNRYLDLADKDGDGEIDTNWKSGSKDKRYSACPVLSPKRKPFSPALFPGHETLYFITTNTMQPTQQLEKPPLSIRTSPAWNGRSINPASFSAPPGLKFQAPLDGPCHGTLPIVPFLTNSQRRIRLKKKQVIHNQTRWIPAHTPTVAPKPRSHPSYYQGFNSKEFKQNGLHNRDTSRYRGRFIICSLNPNTAATETY